jgi:hypothetical protein
MLVECIEKIALRCPRILIQRGVGVSKLVTTDDEFGICAHLEDGTVISATHVIGADGKWSKVRQSVPSLDSQAKIITCPSFGVHLNSPTVPKGFKTDGTYIINPPKECMFYIIASPHPSGGLSISMATTAQRRDGTCQSAHALLYCCIAETMIKHSTVQVRWTKT